ncbi:hypothetical protein AMC99_02356 [Altererythrobacter epoxidivorans]|uniref:Uncharacterized protein n=1 Tax=Altererythrobacter epoxidivorans TaxID=361183 RepID=A0A0M5L7B4_9SPHN|nr:hypothetical protein AMC99_02356 [Altererythrobacter epoxidivorans]
MARAVNFFINPSPVEEYRRGETPQRPNVYRAARGAASARF